MEREVITSAVRKLETLLIEEGSGSLLGSVEDVRGLRNDIKSMLAFLTDSVRSSSDFQEGTVLTDLKQIAIDTNTIIKTFFETDYSRSRPVKTRYGFDPYQDYNYRLIIFRKEISSIRYTLQECRSKFGAGRAKATITRPEYVGRQQGLTAPWKGQHENIIVGMEEDVRLLLDEAILNGAPGLYTCAITGMGGMGKTILARILYRTRGFERRAWVRVSDKASQKEIIIEIVRQLRNFGIEKLYKMMQLDEARLQHRLRNLLQNKRYIIVLDDVGQEPQHWRSVLRGLPKHGYASRLVLTSRTRISAKDAQYIHPMKILDHDKSWELFLKTVFIEHDRNFKCPNHLRIIGEEVVRKCNGLPLAIKEAGWRMSIKKHTASEWEEYLESMDLSVTSVVLESSCDKLPQELKSCFLSLAFFKERTTIRAEKLVHVWTTAGMISREQEKYETTEVIARRYIDRLIVEYMVVIKDVTKDYRVKNIHMNANLHRLSIAKAKEEMGFEIVWSDGRHCQASGRARHRVVFCSRDKFKYSRNIQDKQHLLSLFFRGGGNLDSYPFYLRDCIKLKALDLEGFGLKILPGTSIDTLVELRYLGLRNNYIKELPRALANMKKLEVLDIAHNFMVRVPDYIWKMGSLRHLYMCDVILPEGMNADALENLETLVFIPFSNELSGLGRMRRLRKLGIQDLDESSDASNLHGSILSGLKDLESVILRGFRYRRMPEPCNLSFLANLTQLKVDGLLTSLPNAYYDFPRNLSYLTLVNTCLDEDPMPLLGMLPRLFRLKLRNAYTGRKMAISRGGFHKLEVLQIGELWHLRNLRVDHGAMGKLERLEIYSCPYLETIPAEILLGNNMQELKMVTTRRIARKLRQSSFVSKVRHVDIQP